MEGRIEKFLKDLDERIESNTKSIEEVYELVVTTITKKKHDCIQNMKDAKDKEEKLIKEKHSKIVSHVESINKYLNMKNNLETMNDMDILEGIIFCDLFCWIFLFENSNFIQSDLIYSNYSSTIASKISEETLKLASKQAIDCTFSLSIIPEFKKDIEINNFGKLLKNALRDQESNNSKNSLKQRKNLKQPKFNSSKLQNEKEQKTNSNEEVEIHPDLNTSHDTELSTPVLISAKTNLLNKHFKQKEPDLSTTIKNKSIKKEIEILSQSKQSNIPWSTPNQVPSSRNPIPSIKTWESSKQSVTSFTYQPSKVAEKIVQQINKPIVEISKIVDQNSIISQSKTNEKLSNFKELLESTQQMQRDRIKRKNVMTGKISGVSSFKDFSTLSNIKTEEDSVDEKNALIQSTDKWITEETNEENDLKEEGERGWRNYLKHTKTSRMKSVNRRDQHIKDNIKSEAQMKFEYPAFKKTTKEGLPPGLPQGNSTVTSSSLTNWFKRQSPTIRANEEMRGTPHNSSIANPDMFKLEGKLKALGTRKGSRTNRENAESFDSRFNFRAFDERRAEHKSNQKIAQNSSGIPNIKNYERKAYNKNNKTEQFDK